MAEITKTDEAVAYAREVPELIENLKAVNPAFAEQITGKALIASKSPWGTLLAGIIAWGAGRYGLGWPPEVCTMLAGLGVLVGAYLMRFVSGTRITGIMEAKVS